MGLSEAKTLLRTVNFQRNFSSKFWIGQDVMGLGLYAVPKSFYNHVQHYETTVKLS